MLGYSSLKDAWGNTNFRTETPIVANPLFGRAPYNKPPVTHKGPAIARGGYNPGIPQVQAASYGEVTLPWQTCSNDKGETVFNTKVCQTTMRNVDKFLNRYVTVPENHPTARKDLIYLLTSQLDNDAVPTDTPTPLPVTKSNDMSEIIVIIMFIVIVFFMLDITRKLKIK